MRIQRLVTMIGLGLSVAAWAQAPLPGVFAQTSPAKRALADALARAALPTKGVVLAVDADRVMLPKDGLPPDSAAPTVTDVSDAYGRVVQRFGHVVAVAPPTMVVINTAPGTPDIYAGMLALDAFTLLAASLTDAQWQAMTSEAGLGVSALDSEAQRQLFAAILSPHGRLVVRPQYAVGEKWDEKDKRDLSDQIPQAHLRLGQTITLTLPAKDPPGSEYPGVVVPPPLGAPRRYEIDEREDADTAADTDYGAVVSAEMPNVLKRGALDFSSPALQKIIPLNGLKTVGDLIARVGVATRTELYADARLEEKSLTLIGPPAAPAADLLRALALCLTGIFRRVGPAYVLTDDLVGIGTRCQVWAEFDADADLLRRRPVTAASELLYTRHKPRDLSWFDDPGAYSPEEIASAGPQAVNTEDGFLPELKLPLSQLTPAQQDMVRRAIEKHNAEYVRQPAAEDGPITIRPGLSAELLLPGLAAPVDPDLNHGGTDQYFVFQMPQGEVDAQSKARDEQELKAHPEMADMMAKMSQEAPVADVWASLRSAPRRAAFVHPRTARQVDADVAAAKRLGLTDLWLDVFSGGVAHVPGSVLSSAKPLPAGENDILTEALARTKNTPLRIYATFDLLFWGPSPPARDADRNLLGETSDQAGARWQRRKALLPPGEEMMEETMSNAVVPNVSAVAVSPTSPDVQAALADLVRNLAARPGVAGLIWRGTDLPGYDLLPGGSDTSSLLLGYNPSLRLAFLRRFHADPVDLYDVGHMGSRADMDLPSFSGSRSENRLYVLHDAWVRFRQDAALAFLRTLYAAADPPPSSHMPILVKQRRLGERMSDSRDHSFYTPGWYGSWDDPRQPPPTLHTRYEDVRPGQPSLPAAPEATQAHAQSRIVLTPITPDTLERMRYALGMRQAVAEMPGMRRGMAREAPVLAFVLDLDDLTGGDPADDSLTDLAAQLTSAGALTDHP